MSWWAGWRKGWNEDVGGVKGEMRLRSDRKRDALVAEIGGPDVASRKVGFGNKHLAFSSHMQRTDGTELLS